MDNHCDLHTLFIKPKIALNILLLHRFLLKKVKLSKHVTFLIQKKIIRNNSSKLMSHFQFLLIRNNLCAAEDISSEFRMLQF